MTTSAKSKRRTVPTKIACFTTAIYGFQGGADATRAVVDVAGRLHVKSADVLRSLARSLFDRALKCKKEELKAFAVLSRRLSDRLPRTGIQGSDELLSFAAALHELCVSEFERLCSLQPQSDLSISRGSNYENQENDVHQQRAAQVQRVAEVEGKEGEDKCVDFCSPPAPGELLGDTQGAVHHLMMLQLFSACLYTQDVVPEDFVHKVLDFHRFSGGSSWPRELRFAGLGSAVEMMCFCGKRLERLGSLKHVMPDFYSFLGEVSRDPACPQQLQSQIFKALQLRDNGWIVETFEDPDPLALHDPPMLGR